MSAKKLKSPNHKCLLSTRGNEIKIISKFDCFINSNAKMIQSCKKQVEHLTDLNQNKTASINDLQKNSQNADKQALINQLLLKNLKLKEESDKKNKLIEMLSEDGTEIKRVTSLHFPQENDQYKSKANFRLASPNQMEFTFYKSPPKGLPKEFQIAPSKKMFF